jgi:solute carrier family 13 (sodium-dependent dicarboxylate transporter), member 2/3/5
MLNYLTVRQKTGLVLGPALFILTLLLPLPEGLSAGGLRVAAVALLMACFWMAETVPIPVTATLPIFLFPLLHVMPTAEVTASYGDEILFLFMGGFLLAIAMQRWQLHRRIALNVILRVGSSPERLVLGFLLATALLSMWISNSATAMMMMPVGLAVIEETRADAGQGKFREGEDYPFGTALMLAIAYAASIGGVATLVGTPPNAIFVGLLDSLYGLEIGFLDWMKLAVPVSVLMLALCWFLLTRVLFRMEDNAAASHSAERHIRHELDRLGPLSSEEGRVAVIFTLVAAAWILRGLLKPAFLSMVADSALAMTGAFLLFIVPRGQGKPGALLDWHTAAGIPWDIIVLMGGGFALAEGFAVTGLTEWLALQLAVLGDVPPFVLVLAVVMVVTFLTEMTSNAATATLFIPVMGALAVSMGLHPLTLMVPTCIAASMAFMLPVATPPNAIVFGSRMISIRQMATAGLWLNLVGGLIVAVLCYCFTDVLR